jgi:hypothetical protein
VSVARSVDPSYNCVVITGEPLTTRGVFANMNSRSAVLLVEVNVTSRDAPGVSVTGAPLRTALGPTISAITANHLRIVYPSI